MKLVPAAIALALCAPLGCGADGPRFEDWVIDDLDGEQGFSLRVPEFEVAPGRESQNCYFVTVPDLGVGNDIWIERVLTAINPGSHHVNVFRVKTIIDLNPDDGTPTMLGKYPATVIEGSDDYMANPCWGSANWADWPLIANSQHANVNEPKTDWQLPTDVAIRLHPGEMLMLQTHYVNSGEQATKYGARVGINFYRRQKAEAPIEMGSLFATQQNIRICASRPRASYSGTCRFPGAVTVAAANGHFHKRGVTFSISAWDGKSIDHPPAEALFYQSKDWNEPPMATDLAVSQPANSGIWWDCEYQWHAPTEFTCDDVNAKDPLKEGDCCYVFGGNTDVGEHCNVFLYYYPKVESDLFCL
jgi:hypothetical protein